MLAFQTTLSDLVSDNSEAGFLRRPNTKMQNTLSPSKALSVISSESQSVRQLEMSKSSASKAKGANLIEVEKMEIGGVKWAVYAYYARSIGLSFTTGTFALYLIYQGFSLGSNIWLSEWSTDPLANTDDSVRNMYLGKSQKNAWNWL